MGKIIVTIFSISVSAYYILTVYLAGVGSVAADRLLPFQLLLGAVFLLRAIVLYERSYVKIVEYLCIIIMGYVLFVFYPKTVATGFFFIFLALFYRIIIAWQHFFIAAGVGTWLLWGELPNSYWGAIGVVLFVAAGRLAFGEFIKRYINAELVSFDDIFSGGFHFHEPHKIYGHIMLHVNSRLGPLGSIDGFVFAKKEKGKYIVVNSYPIVNTVDIRDDIVFFDSKKNRNVFVNSILVDEEEYFFFVKYSQLMGLVVCRFALASHLKKLALHYKEEEEIRAKLSLWKNELRENLDVLESCRSYAHDVRGRLGPIKTILKFNKRFQPIIGDALEAKHKKYFIKHLGYAQNTLDKIESNIDNLLDKYGELSASVVSKVSCVELSKRVKLECAGQLEVSPQVEEWSDCSGWVNEIGFEMVLTNIFSNMRNHSIGDNRIEMRNTEKYLVLFFSNKYDPNYSKIEHDINILEDDENREILLKRRRHGLALIRSDLERMRLGFESSAKAGVFTMRIFIPKERV